MDSSSKPRICISVCELTLAGLERAIAAAAEVSDLIEVRLDCLEPAELQTSANPITRFLQETRAEFILTLRPSDQGGQRQLDDETRHTFWSDAIFSNSLYDVELDLAEKFAAHETATALPIDWRRTICSHHDFSGVPAKLDQIYDRMAATPARVLKIAVQADDAIDCLPIFNLLERARQEGREMIAIAMGAAGVATRILGPSRGSYLTYASLETEAATAPGQISVRELQQVYRLEKIDRQTAVFGLIGHPISHSLSPVMHNGAFAAAGTNAVYVPFEVHDVHAFLKRMIHPQTRELVWNMRGLSVTAPHKFAVMDSLDWIDPSAGEIGVVNTVVVHDDGLHGYNTDASGFIKPLLTAYGDLRDARCAVVGAGGSASAALFSLKAAGAAVTVFSRDVSKASALAQRFGAESMPLEGASFKGFDVVVNATPAGTLGRLVNETPASASQLRGARLAYDLVYNPTETAFLREAREAGCQALGGLAMLVGQATEQFKLWTGEAPQENVMAEAAMRRLSELSFVPQDRRFEI
jgi:3-dehydroquinate dehydratase/shikimate dehydrogenase